MCVYMGCVCIQGVGVLSLLPDPREESEEEEDGVALGEGGQEGEHTVDGQGDDEATSAAHLVGHAPPEERPHHHTQEHDKTCTREGDGQAVETIHGSIRFKPKIERV